MFMRVSGQEFQTVQSLLFSVGWRNSLNLLKSIFKLIDFTVDVRNQFLHVVLCVF